MPLRSNSLSFSSSPRFGNAYSYSYDWPSRTGPADDGSCSQNVAVMVLNAFDIPIVGSYPPRGNLCGLDINNMSAMDAIKLSLAENIAIGKLYELYLNEYGQAYFQEVYPNAPLAYLDIRMCIPSSNIQSAVDGVIVRGYDKPPVREFKPFVSVEWVGNAYAPFQLENVGYINQHFYKEARRSYKDPVLETSYNDGIDNLYELNAFESVAGYVIDLDLPTQPDDVTTKYSFSGTTTKEVDLTVAVGIPSDVAAADVPYGGYSASIGSYRTQDKYGDVWPLLNSVSQITCIGHKVISARDWSALPGSNRVTVAVDAAKEVFSLSAGTNWYWELNPDSSATVYIYYQVGETGSDPELNADLLTSGAYERTVVYYSRNTAGVSEPTADIPGGSGGFFIPNIGGGLGIYVDKLFATVELDRPSVVVQDGNGNALGYAQTVELKYQPIVVTDEPPPVAYTFGGGAQLVDHTLDLYDNDPATAEITPTSRTGSLSWLQSAAQGHIIDVSLPFLSEDDCLLFADSLYNMYNEGITTYSLVCGPTSEPQLGARVAGLEGRINNITYSFQDSSSYNINVTVGPTIQNVGNWSNNLWQKQTEDVSREGIIVWTAGDGVNYLVRVRGMGVYQAVNMTLAAYAPGEKVQVTIHNNPKEA